MKEYSYTRSITSKVEETICKESDPPIVPKKPVTTAEGRGEHIDCSKDKTSATPEVEAKNGYSYIEGVFISQPTYTTYLTKFKYLVTFTACIYY
ncbi:MAG: hypothetical protein QME46_11820 [Thermoanaerobacteraceae bacterium]|nr:hypothetical protein [Thermoanaerobacteraceae bacterium]